MKLENIDVYVVGTEEPHLGGGPWFFIKLTTDDGVAGWGETALLAALSRLDKSYEKLMPDIFEAYLKGRDALDRESLVTTLYARLCWQHADYFAGGLISAFDTALWDIAGKYYGAPVYQLLGGKFRDRIRAYSYICHPRKGYAGLGHEPQYVADMAAEMVEEEGFTAVKYDPVPQINGRGVPLPPWQPELGDLRKAETAVRLIREAVGDAADILIGTHGQTTPSGALRLAKRLEPYDPLWFEEPVPPENADEMAKVAAATSIPVATGERLVSVHDFLRLFKAGAAAIAQPDAGSSGGITQLKKIAALAEPFYVQMAPHVWGGPLITAAALQIDAVIPNFLIQESIYTSRGFFDKLLVEPFRFEKGYLIPSERPGIGAEPDEKQLLKYALNK